MSFTVVTEEQLKLQLNLKWPTLSALALTGMIAKVRRQKATFLHP